MTASRLLRHLAFLTFTALLAVSFSVRPAAAIGTDDPPAPRDSGDKKPDKKSDQKKTNKKGKDKSSDARDLERKRLADQRFLDGYRAARELIVSGHYRDGITAMHALGHDEHPDVANYIGYADRRLGEYNQSKYWYEKALAADPRHVRTWSYYGMWHAEQGNRLKAEEFLAKVKLICGNTTCKEYTELKAVIDGTASY